MGEAGRDRLDGVLSGRTARILGNTMFLTLFTAAVFCVFLTPIVGVLSAPRPSSARRSAR